MLELLQHQPLTVYVKTGWFVLKNAVELQDLSFDYFVLRSPWSCPSIASHGVIMEGVLGQPSKRVLYTVTWFKTLEMQRHWKGHYINAEWNFISIKFDYKMLTSKSAGN